MIAEVTVAALAAGTAVTTLGALIYRDASASAEDRRRAARVAILAPGWPVLLAVWSFRFIARLWQEAELWELWRR